MTYLTYDIFEFESMHWIS